MNTTVPHVQQILDDLQFNSQSRATSRSRSTRYSSIIVETDTLCFLLKAQGNLTGEEKDTYCHALLKKVKGREKRELERLYLLYSVLKYSSQYSSCFSVTDATTMTTKDLLQRYFDDTLTDKLLQSLKIERLGPSPPTEGQLIRVRQDIRSLVSTHGDQPWTGRAVARVLQGIPSPCYPAEVWGRLRQFWRRHLDIDFDQLCTLATHEIIAN